MKLNCFFVPFFVAAAIQAHNKIEAGTITSQGAVTALTHVTEIGVVIGQGGFDESSFGTISTDTYSAEGMVIHGTIPGTGTQLESILPNIVSTGRVFRPRRINPGNKFPTPIGGGGSQINRAVNLTMGATFTVDVTQFGATLSRNQRQFITAWRSDGALIGQVTWEPDGLPGEGLDASFVGLDTGQTPIAFVLIGNDNMFAGASADPSGSTTIFDSVIWGVVPEPTTGSLIFLSILCICLPYRCR